MTRRQIHQSIAIAVTLVFMACAAYGVLVARDWTWLWKACGAYVGFLLLFSLVCWMNVPPTLRDRPPMPEEFRALRVGPVSASMAAVLGRFAVVEDRMFGTKRHRLFQLEQSFPQGTWCCRVEEVAGEIVAHTTAFASVASPVLDVSAQHGAGRFLTAPI